MSKFLIVFFLSFNVFAQTTVEHKRSSMCLAQDFRPTAEERKFNREEKFAKLKKLSSFN